MLFDSFLCHKAPTGIRLNREETSRGQLRKELQINMGAWEHAHPHPRARTLPSACHLCVQSPRRGDCPAPAPRTRPRQGLPGSRPDRRPRRPCAEAPAAGGHPTPGLGEGRDGARGGSPCSGGPPLPVLRGQREHTGTWGRNAKGATKPRCQSARLPGSRAGGPRQDSGARGLRAALPRRGLHRGARGLGPGVGGRGGRWGSFVTPDPTPPPLNGRPCGVLQQDRAALHRGPAPQPWPPVSQGPQHEATGLSHCFLELPQVPEVLFCAVAP